MDLSRLYTTGTKLADVKPDFRGMPLAEWLQKVTCRMIQTVAAERALTGEEFAIEIHSRQSKKKVAEQRVYTPRDGYGMKGVR